MDVFSHGLWSVALYKALNLYKKTKFQLALAAFWGIFPDLFAFGPLFIWRIVQALLGNPVTFGKPIEPSGMSTLPIYMNTHFLYDFSHSAVIFLFVFILVCIICKHHQKPLPWILGGWFLHILCDVPTHSYRFYPTPILWPISEWKFNGISWGTPWFMLANYTALFVVYFLLWRKQMNKTAHG